MRTVIDNKDIAGLPEAYQEQEITLVPHLNAFIADNFLESLEKTGSSIDWDLYSVSYQGKLGYTLLASTCKEETKICLLPMPCGDVESILRGMQESLKQ